MSTQEPSLEEFNRVICIKIVPTSGIASYWITVSYNDISWSDKSQEIKIEPQVNIQWGRIDQNSITLDNYRWTKESIKDNLYNFFYLTLSQCKKVYENNIENIEISHQLYQNYDQISKGLIEEIEQRGELFAEYYKSSGGKKSLRKKNKKRPKKKSSKRKRKN